MTATPASIRALYPEFASTTTYSDAMINQWLTVATLQMNAGRWGDLLDYGVSLYVAHRLSLAAKNARAAQFGKQPGAATGPVTSKGADKVNISYDVRSVVEEGGGFWNLTTYGQEYIRQARLMGAGPLQVGAPTDGAGQSLFTGVYGGPYG